MLGETEESLKEALKRRNSTRWSRTITPVSNLAQRHMLRELGRSARLDRPTGQRVRASAVGPRRHARYRGSGGHTPLFPFLGAGGWRQKLRVNTSGAAPWSLVAFFLMAPRFSWSTPAAPPAPAPLSHGRPPCPLAASRSLRALTLESLGEHPQEPKQRRCRQAASVGPAHTPRSGGNTNPVSPASDAHRGLGEEGAPLPAAPLFGPPSASHSPRDRL